jgi:hypothetical protein
MSRIDRVGIARQSSGQGTAAVATMEYFPTVESADENQNRETLSIEETVGNRFPTGIDYGTRFFEVPLALAPRMSSYPRLLSGFLGQPDSVAGGTALSTAGSNVHTFDPTGGGTATKIAEWHTLLVERNDPSAPIIDSFYNARGNEFEMSVQPNDFLRSSMSWIALDVDGSGTAHGGGTVGRDTSHRRKFSEVTIELDTTGSGTAWSTAVAAAWGMTYSNQLDTDEAVLGSRSLYALPMGNATCELRFSPRESLATHYRRALQTDPTTIALRMTATGPVIGTSSVTEKIVVTCWAIEVTDAPAAVSGADVLKMVEVTARAKQRDSDGAFITVAVTNGVTSY